MTHRGGVSPSSKTVKLGDNYGDLPTPIKDGYTFLGWKISSGGNYIQSSSQNTTIGNHTLVAYYYENPCGYLSNDWKSRIGATDLQNTTTSITFTSDSSKISGLTNSVSVGTLNETTTSAYTANSGVNDVIAYWGSSKANIVIYSRRIIYAPQSCYQAFYNLTNLATLKLDNFDTSKVTSMQYMFYKCSALASLDVSKFDTSNVTTMTSMFRNCSSLTSLDAGNFNTKNVTVMYYMFSNCSALTSLNVANFDTSNVTDMRYMFYNCSSLIGLGVGNFRTTNVTDVSYMFAKCSGLTSLNLGLFKLTNCTSFGSMLASCSSLDLIVIPYTLTSGYTIALPDSTYYNGSAGPYSTVGTATSGTTVKCSTAATKVTLTRTVSYLSSDWKTRIGSTDLQNTTQTIIFTNDSSKISGLSNNVSVGTVSETSTSAYTSTTRVSDVKAYWGSTKQTIVIYSANVIVAPQSCQQCFYSLKSLTTLDLRNFNTSKTTLMQGMFRESSLLTNIDISLLNTYLVTDMSNMFYECSALARIDVGGFITKYVTDIRRMFYHCSSLTSVNLSNFVTTNVTQIQRIFNGCSSLTSIDMGNINIAGCTDFSNMFYDCSALKTLTLPYNLQSGYTISLPASNFYNASTGAGPYDTVGTETSGTTVACSTASNKVTLTKQS